MATSPELGGKASPRLHHPLSTFFTHYTPIPSIHHQLQHLSLGVDSTTVAQDELCGLDLDCWKFSKLRDELIYTRHW